MKSGEIDTASGRVPPSEAVLLSPGARPWRRTLRFKYTAMTVLLVGVGLAVLAVPHVLVTYRQAMLQAGQTQVAQARELATAVEAVLSSIERQVRLIDELPWEVEGWLSLPQRMQEYRRLLRMAPVVARVRYVDAAGVQAIVVSRRDVDRLDGDERPARVDRARPGRSVPARLGDVADDPGHEAIVPLAITTTDHGAGRTVVDVSLLALANDLSGVLSHSGPVAYVTDAGGRVVLHRDPSLIVGRRSIDAEPAADGGALPMARKVRGLDGGEAMRSSYAVGATGWRVHVEQASADVLRPVLESAVRTAATAAAWLALVLLAAVYLARRLTDPVSVLARGANELAGGRLEARIALRSDDEHGDLARQFNAMAASLQQTIEQQEQRITEKTQALEVANRHKSEFLANMSHELRTPLNAVIGMSEVLAEQEVCGPLTAKQLEYMTDIHNSGTHLLALINEILDMSKVESGRMELDRVVVDVGSQVAQAVALVRDRADRQGVQLGVTVAPDPCEWRVDPQRFRQILLNLLSNAVKFTAHGGRVKLDARIDARGLVVEVEDTGRGIAPEHLPMVFEPFRQFGAQPGLPVEGTGLGLALVRRLVELHGGSVVLDSKVGQGSRFTLVFPEVDA